MVKIVNLQENGEVVIPKQAYCASNNSEGESLSLESLLKAMYPVGSIYFTTSATNPGATGGVFAGRGMTWVAFGAGRVPVGVDSDHPVEGVGGSKTHAITTDELPSHGHGCTSGGGGSFTLSDNLISNASDASKISGAWGQMGATAGTITQTYFSSSSLKYVSGAWRTVGVQLYDHTHTIQNTGGGAAMNIEQPYIGVYMWKRTE